MSREEVEKRVEDDGWESDEEEEESPSLAYGML